MLSSLFQDSDFILFMLSDHDKVPHSPIFVSVPRAGSYLGTYYSINPIDPHTNRNLNGARAPRASINVSAFRNFLFEMDSMPLETQEKLLRYIHPRIPIAQVVFSGSSSLHAIISVSDTLPFRPHTSEGIAQYSQAWRALNAELIAISKSFLGDDCADLFDQACKDPARLSRTPGAVRPDNKATQTELPGFGGYLSADQVLQLMNKHSESDYKFTVSDAGPASTEDRGQLSKRTLDFINGYRREHAHLWDWHNDFIFAVKDLQSQNFTMDECIRMLTCITGHLDSNDMYQIRDIWSRNNFKLEFRPRKSK